MLKVFDILALLFYCAMIYWLSDQPSLPLPMLFEYQDKLHHFTAYFLMGILASRNFRHFVEPPFNLAVVSIVFCSLYAISDEWHQSFVVGREADALDWVADTVGAIVAMFLLTRYYPYQKPS
ncbi:VanZ family protein [Methyloglobulus sp.]|uniref:VanZ family protein n=1 Tax=Methyloglobulus sp. TaxID=2518622 RepID=UPI003988EFDB